MTDYRDHPNLTDQVPQESEQINFLEYLRVFWRHKGSILFLALLAAVWSSFLALTQVPIYESTASLLLEPRGTKVINIQDVYSVESESQNYEATQIDILRSRTLAEKVIAALELEKRPEFAARLSTTQDTTFGGLLSIDWTGLVQEQLHNLGLSGPPAGSIHAAEVNNSALVDHFLENLRVLPPDLGSLIRISYRSPDRLLAAKVANTLADTYIENELDARLAMTSKANSWLMDRLGGLREKLRESEAALQAFREQEDIVSVDGSSTLTGQRLQSINDQLNEAERARNQIKLSLDQIRSFGTSSVDRLSTVPAVMADPLFSSLRQKETEAARSLDALSKRYGPKHPSLLRAQTDLDAARESTRDRMERIFDSLQEEYKIASANVANIKQQFSGASKEMQQLNRKGHELSVLEREVETNRQLYDRFLSRFKETNESGGLEKVNARVVDPAIPGIHAVEPNKKRIVVIGTAIGLLLGIAIALLLEKMDKTLKHGTEIEEKLHISSLGAVPQIKLRSRRGETPLSHAKSNRKSFFSESIRSLRTGVLLSGLDNPKKIILVTSSIPGEGKSTIAMNLAHSIGDMEKVLLIDADMRRPTIGKHWGLAKDAKGLSEFVAQSAKLGECVHSIEGSRVYIMPSGAVPPNPLELLSSKRFSVSLATLSNTFDYIIIDSAPAMAVSDALILASYASGVVYVIKAMSTPYPLAREGIKRLVTAKGHIVGGVLNALPVSNNARYYGRYPYLGYYHKEYYGSYGYTKEKGA